MFTNINNKNIKTDTFKIFGTSPLVDISNGSLQELRIAINQLVGKRSDQDEAEFKASLKVADSIEINGKIAWNRAKEKGVPQELEGEWSKEAKEKFQEIVKDYQAFTEFQPEQISELQILIQGLNRDLVRSAQTLVSQHYRFDNKPYTFTFEYPPNNSLAQLKFKKQGSLFAFELCSSARVVGLGTKFYELTLEETLKSIEGPHKVNSEITFCEITVIAQLNLADFPKKIEAAFEIKVSSDSQKFKYCGPLWTPEIIELQNIDLHPKMPIIDTLQKTNIQMGIILERILSNTSNEPEKLLSAILYFFTQTMKIVLLKNKKDDLFNHFSIDSKELLSAILKENKKYPLLALTKDELISTFRILKGTEILQLLTIFNGIFIPQISQSALVICEAPNNFFLKHGYIVHEQFLKCTNSFIWQAINIIKSALETVSQEKIISTRNSRKQETITIDINDDSPFFERYLVKIIQNKLENNPFQELLLSSDEFLEIIQPSLNNNISLNQPTLPVPNEKEALIHFKTITNIQMGITLEKITIPIKPELHSLLLSILRLFNQTIQDLLLKNKMAESISPTPNFGELITFILSKNKNFNLLGECKKQLISTFRTFENTTLSKLLNIFQGALITNIKNAILVEQQKSPDEIRIENEQYISKITLSAITTIGSALQIVGSEKKKSMPKSEEILIDIESLNLSENFWENYLSQATQNKLEDNPFQDPVIKSNLSTILTNASLEDNLALLGNLKVFTTSKTVFDKQIEMMAEKIIILSTHPENQLSLILHLFNQTIKTILLKQEELFNNIRIDLPGLTAMTLREYEPFNLLQTTKDELISIFSILEDPQFFQFLNLFQETIIPAIQPSALFLSSSETYKNKELYQNIAEVISSIINIMESALEQTKTNKKILQTTFKKSKKITNFKDVNPIFHQLSSKAIETETSPFKNQLIAPALFAKIKVFSNSEIEEEEIELIHFRAPPARNKMRFCVNSETAAVLLTRNPLVKAINDLALPFSIGTVLSLYPGISNTIWQRYLSSICYTVIPTGGAVIGVNAILNPNKPMNSFVRLWESMTDGAVVFVSLTNNAIAAYLITHPKANYISNEIFWGEIASGPLALSTLYVIWNCASPVMIFKKKHALHIKAAIDLISKALFYNGIFSLTELTFFKPNDWREQLIPSVPAICAALGSLTSSKEKVNVFMIYLIAANLSFLLIQELSSQLNDKENKDKTSLSLLYSQMGYWSLSLVLWTFFIIKNSITFTREYIGNPEIIARIVPKERLSQINNSSSSQTMSLKDYNALLKNTTGSFDEKSNNQIETTALLFQFKQKNNSTSYNIEENLETDITEPMQKKKSNLFG